MYCIVNKVHHKSKVYAIVAIIIQKRNADMVDRRSPVTLHRESKGKEKNWRSFEADRTQRISEGGHLSKLWSGWQR